MRPWALRVAQTRRGGSADGASLRTRAPPSRAICGIFAAPRGQSWPALCAHVSAAEERESAAYERVGGRRLTQEAVRECAARVDGGGRTRTERVPRTGDATAGGEDTAARTSEAHAVAAAHRVGLPWPKAARMRVGVPNDARYGLEGRGARRGGEAAARARRPPMEGRRSASARPGRGLRGAAAMGVGPRGAAPPGRRGRGQVMWAKGSRASRAEGGERYGVIFHFRLARRAAPARARAPRAPTHRTGAVRTGHTRALERSVGAPGACCVRGARGGGKCEKARDVHFARTPPLPAPLSPGWPPAGGSGRRAGAGAGGA